MNLMQKPTIERCVGIQRPLQSEMIPRLLVRRCTDVLAPNFIIDERRQCRCQGGRSTLYKQPIFALLPQLFTR